MCPRNIHGETQCYYHKSASSNRGAAAGKNHDPQAPFTFFFRSAHHFRFASLRRFRTAALIRRRVGFSAFRTFLRRCRAAVVPSRAEMAWLRRSRSAFSSVRMVSSVNGGSSHCILGLTYTTLSSRLLLKYPTADEYTRSQSHRAIFEPRKIDGLGTRIKEFLAIHNASHFQLPGLARLARLTRRWGAPWSGSNSRAPRKQRPQDGAC